MSTPAEKISPEAILERVRQVLVSSFELEPARVVPDAHLFDDLELDSIDAIDLIIGLEEESGLGFDEDELRQLRVVQDVVDLLQAKLLGT